MLATQDSPKGGSGLLFGVENFYFDQSCSFRRIIFVIQTFLLPEDKTCWSDPKIKMCNHQMICLKQFPKDYLFNFCSAAAMWRRSRLKFSFSKENLLEMSVGSSIFWFALIWLGRYAKKQERENNLILENVTRGKWNGLMTRLFGIRFILDHLFWTQNIYKISSVIIGN